MEIVFILLIIALIAALIGRNAAKQKRDEEIRKRRNNR